MNAWIEAARFASDSQRVVALRLMRLATGGPLAASEATQMISEKVALAGPVAANILMGGSPDRAVKRYRGAVRANRRRLSR